MDKGFEVITWSMFDKACMEIAEWAKGYNFKTVSGIPRGGLIVAVKMSHLLDVPMTFAPNKYTLLLDDVVETGTTISRYLQNNRPYKIASLAYCKKSKIVPDKYVFEKQELFMLFPWETVGTAKVDYMKK